MHNIELKLGETPTGETIIVGIHPQGWKYDVGYGKHYVKTPNGLQLIEPKPGHSSGFWSAVELLFGQGPQDESGLENNAEFRALYFKTQDIVSEHYKKIEDARFAAALEIVNNRLPDGGLKDLVNSGINRSEMLEQLFRRGNARFQSDTTVSYRAAGNSRNLFKQGQDAAQWAYDTLTGMSYAWRN